MTEIRCVKCNRLLMKIGSLYGEGDNYSALVESKCPKCGYKNDYTLESMRMDDLIAVKKGTHKGRLLKAIYCNQ